MDKNETKNIAIILLTIFLVFSFIVNVYYYVASQAGFSNNDLTSYYMSHFPRYGASSFEGQNGGLASLLPGTV